MKIAAIETILLTIPYRASGRIHFIIGWPSPRFSMLFVRVPTDEGMDGWGEAFGRAVAPGTKTVLNTVIAPLFIGCDPADITALMNDAQRKLHIFGRNGSIMYGRSGIDIALWDIAAKTAGLPLYKLLGGSNRADVLAYSSLVRCAGPDAVAESCGTALEHGFDYIKLHEIALPCIHTALDAVDPGVALMVDTNCPWSVLESVAMVEALRPLHLYWLESPFAELTQVRRGRIAVPQGAELGGDPDTSVMNCFRVI